MNVQLYDSSGATVGSRSSLNSNNSVSQSVTVGKEYYIRVLPSGSSGSGTYKIAFNASYTAPPITLPSSAIQLTVNTWADGNIATAGDQEWFKFTATASTQYIHFNPGTLYGVSVQVYDSSGVAVGSQSSLPSYSPSGMSNIVSQNVTVGQEYYIRIRAASDIGTYRIAYNTTPYPPGTIVTQLTVNTWADSNITTAGDREWFKFTATASTQYIHYSLGSELPPPSGDGPTMPPPPGGGLPVQVYDSSGAAVGSQSYVIGHEYYIRTSSSFSYRIMFNTTPYPPDETTITTLTENTWTDGNLPTYNDEQWFKFTATANTQDIHVEFGTLNYLYVQVYDSSGTEVGSQSFLNNSTSSVSRSVTVGQVYYIRIRATSRSGTYKIAFNTSETTLPLNATTLTENIWADGNIVRGGGQWFKFTATASTQFIHFNPGTLNLVSVQVYASSGAEVGDETELWSSITSVSQSVTVGQVYYIRVWQSSSSSSGTYKIAFNAIPYSPDITITTLTVNTWADGNLPRDGEQWFKFTATENTQYIHFNPGTLNNVRVQVYDSSGAEVGSQSYTVGQEYYIRAWPYSSSSSGTYQIAFNATETAPPITLPSNAIHLTENIWADGNPTTSSNVQWFKFTATADTQCIHADVGTLNWVSVQVYDSSGIAADGDIFYSFTGSVSHDVTVGQEYYIRVKGGSSGTYRLMFNAKPYPPDETAIPTLTVNTWADGELYGSYREQQWFKFTATASTQFIHFNLGTLFSLYVQVYDSSGTAVGSQSVISLADGGSPQSSVSQSAIVGQMYYIRASSDGNIRGTYRIAFNASETAPSP